MNRALSKIGVLTRSQATAAVLEGRVTVNGRVIRNPAAAVDLDRARIAVDDRRATRTPWRTILFHKPRGLVTTRRDPEGRPTVYDVLGDSARALVPVGRLDLATSGLLVLTSDRELADWITNPGNAVARVYLVTVRGKVSGEDAERLAEGVKSGAERLQATRVTVRKVSNRESHLTIELREGRNREVRRLCAAVGHEVTRLKRIRLGGLELGRLAPGAWRELSREDVQRAFPGHSMIP